MSIFFVWDKHLKEKNTSYNKELLAKFIAICFSPILELENTARLQNKKYELKIHDVTMKQGDLLA